MVIANLVQVLGGELELTVMVSSSTFWFRSSVFQSHTLVYEEGAFRLSGMDRASNQNYLRCITNYMEPLWICIQWGPLGTRWILHILCQMGSRKAGDVKHGI